MARPSGRGGPGKGRWLKSETKPWEVLQAGDNVIKSLHFHAQRGLRAVFLNEPLVSLRWLSLTPSVKPWVTFA